MLAIDVVYKVFGGILQKYENRFALFVFFWSILVAGRAKHSTNNWEQYGLNSCNIIRVISVPLLHRYPLDWLFIFTSTSMFSFVLQKKQFLGIVLSVLLHTILYFLLLGLSPLTYWNFGKQFFNLLVWPDDPRQLAFEIGIPFAVGVMALHILSALGEKLLNLVKIDWLLVVSIMHPSACIYLFSSNHNLPLLATWFSGFQLSIKYKQTWLVRFFGVVFVFLYANVLAL